MMSIPANDLLVQRADEILHRRQRQIYCRTDRMFAVLMLVQWAGAVGAALYLSPTAWSGATPSLHQHVWLAFVLGGALASLPIWLAWRHPGEAVTRYTISAAQVMFSSLLIHVSGGRIETHFHVFGSLAFLAAYRDWGVLVVPTVLVAVDHFVRGVFWPETVFGIATASQWRWIEHAGWVLFEDLFLMIIIRTSNEEMRNNALQAAHLENNHAELQRYSEQLSRAFEKEQAIIEGSLDAVVEMDRRGTIVEWNAQAEQIFGWEAAEVLGHPLADLIIPVRHRDDVLMSLKRQSETGEGLPLNQRFELEGLDRSGREFPIELAIVPIQGSDETTYCAFVADITDRKTHELKLRQAMDQAEAANRTKSEFLANMSHEIRTPLNGITGYAELLARNADKGDEDLRRDYIETIRTSGRHLLELINNILDLSKIEAGQLQVENTRFSPHQVIAEVASVLRVRAGEKGILLDYRWEGAIPEAIVSDPYRLRQLLMNLVGNAIKFTEQGSVMIIASADRSAGHSYLVLEVRDTGIGIDSSKLDEIFKPFVQADNSMTRRYGGTGLGLAICKNIASALGGELTVESQLGRGTTFIAHICVGDLALERMLDVPPEATVGDYVDLRESAANLNGVRVLLADDGETNRKLIQVFLSRHGAEVRSVENGDLACRTVQTEEFDVVLMDMQMPVMDGYAAARKLRSLGFEKPIIALTAHAMKGDREKCTAAGCSGYVSKPVNVDALIREVQSAARASGLLGHPPEERDASPAGKSAWNVEGPIHSNLPTEDELLREIVAEFVESVPQRIEAMEQALAAEDLEEMARLAHGLKGAGGTAGFPFLTELSAQLEHSVGAHCRAEIVELLGELRAVEPLIVV